MKPFTTSVLSFVLLVIGIVAATHILMLLGRNNTTHQKYLRWAHRISGYIFFALYLFVSTVMFQKLAEFTFLPPKATIHAYIGITIFPMIIAKICIVRFYRKYYNTLPIYGMIILISVYLQVPLYAGFYIFSD